MQIAFSTPQLRDLCENSEKAQEEWGNDAAAMLRRRLADFVAAETINDMIALNLIPIESRQNAELQLPLTTKVCLTIAPNQYDKGSFKDGIVQWQKVGRIKILKIEVCHE
ncbi:MAG: hypothetical protein RLZZ156_2690 [Deinococcota bacterium]|jgi:hypothetical protein